MNKVLKAGIILMIISSAVAVIVSSLMFFLTPIIESNQKKEEQKALNELYTDATFKNITISNELVNTLYEVYQNEILVGYIYKVNGTNKYGEISLFINLDLNDVIINIKVIKNTQSYKTLSNSHLMDNYLDNNLNKIDEVDIYCGATSSAKLIKELITEINIIHGELYGN